MILGILLRYNDLKQGGHWDHVYLMQCYFQLMAEKYGVTLCAIMNPCDAQRLCQVCDGLIIPGSSNDVYPEYYGGTPRETLSPVDEYGHDSKIIDLFIKARKPVFGICQGIQTLNVYFGGSLKQVNANYSHGLPRVDQKQMHPINIKKDSFVYDVFGAERAVVNSFHNWGIDRLGEGLTVVATADDGVIEAVENTEQQVFAVQWHPEQSFRIGDEIEQRFFENFIKLCKQ